MAEDSPRLIKQITDTNGDIFDICDPNVPSWAKAAQKPSYTKSEVGLGNVDNVQQYSASNPPPYPVTSVNGESGAVILDSDDIAYDTNYTIKEKVDAIITAGGEPNVIDTVKQNGTALTVVDKAVNVTVPTKVSDLTNDTGYTTNSGTVTAITLNQGTGISIGSSGTPITTFGSRTISLADEYGDTKNPYASKDAGNVLAAPQSEAGLPSFRKLNLIDIKPVLSKTYTGVYCSGDNDPKGYLYYGKILPIDDYKPWSIHYRVHMEVPKNSSNTSYYMYFNYDGDILINGSQNSILNNKIWNDVLDTSYRCVYQHIVYSTPLTANASDVGHLLGFRFYSSKYPTNVNYARNIVIDILEIKNCSFSFYDSMTLVENIPDADTYWNDTNYRRAYNAYDNGLQETSDANSGNYNLYEYKLRVNAASDPIYRYKLIGLNSKNNAVPLTITNQSSTTLVDKTPTSQGFRPSDIWYYATTTTTSANGLIPNGILFKNHHSFDTRYTFNAAIPAYRMIYLKGSYNENTNLFYLDTTTHTSWYVYVPCNNSSINLTDYFVSGSYYILVGSSNAETNTAELFIKNPLFYFDGTNLVSLEHRHTNKSILDSIPSSGTTGYVLKKTNDGAEWAAETEGQLNVIEKVKRNGVELTVVDKAVDVSVPTKTSDLTNDSGFLTSYTESDPIFEASVAHGITSSDVQNWNNKSDFSGDYDDLTNKPSIPSSGSATSSTTGISIANHSTSSIYGVGSTTTVASKVTVSGANGSAPTLGTAFTIPNVTARGSGSFTQGAFTGGSLTSSVTDHELSFTFTPATHGNDSHTHTAPTLGTAFTVPNVTSAGSASTWSITATDVTVPIKNSNATTVVTGATHNVTDNGHTHTISIS